jgi:hypothetical protein
MDAQSEALLAPSFPRALIVSAAEIALLIILWRYVLGETAEDPLLKIFLIVMVVVMPPIFAAFLCLLIRCRFDRDGLRQESFGFFEKNLPWTEATRVQGRMLGLFYVVYGKGLNNFCIVPGPLLLKYPEHLKQLIRQYAPADNIVRRRLVA